MMEASNVTIEDLVEFPISPIEGYQLNIVGAYILIVFVLGFFVNLLLLIGLASNNKQNSDAFVISCVSTSLIGIIIEFPFAVGSPLSHRYFKFFIEKVR